jgi:hypothetical protein
MGRWLGRLAPLPPFTGSLAAYLNPAVVRALLDIPTQQRRDGSLFDAAIARGEPNLLEVARRATSPTLRDRCEQALPTRVRRRVSGWDRDWAMLEPILREVDAGYQVTRRVLGERWWQQTCAAASHSPHHRHMLWNAVAVDALALRLGSAG